MSENNIPPFNISSAIVSLVADISQLLGRISILDTVSTNLRLRRINRIRTIAVLSLYAPEVTPEVKRMLIAINGEMTRQQIQEKLGLKDEKHFREHYQQPAVFHGLIEMTIPDKPNSRLQKYRLTPKGIAVIKKVL